MKNFKGTESRYIITKEYCERYIPKNSIVLDLGYENSLTKYLESKYRVKNTEWNLDKQPAKINNLWDYEYITSFEVFEHLLNPYSVLSAAMTGTKLLCSVPLRVFYSKPHWQDEDYKQHYHEFIPREFFKLLEKTGFEILFSKEHCIVKNFGIRQLITALFRVKRYLFVVAEKMT